MKRSKKVGVFILLLGVLYLFIVGVDYFDAPYHWDSIEDWAGKKDISDTIGLCTIWTASVSEEIEGFKYCSTQTWYAPHPLSFHVLTVFVSEDGKRIFYTMDYGLKGIPIFIPLKEGILDRNPYNKTGDLTAEAAPHP